jgi:hypothetical protein
MHVDESGVCVGESAFATVIGASCIARVLLTYAITESREINPAVVAIAPRKAGFRAMTVRASASNPQNPAAKTNSVSGIGVSHDSVHFGPVRVGEGSMVVTAVPHSLRVAEIYRR